MQYICIVCLCFFDYRIYRKHQRWPKMPKFTHFNHLKNILRNINNATNKFALNWSTAPLCTVAHGECRVKEYRKKTSTCYTLPPWCVACGLNLGWMMNMGWTPCGTSILTPHNTLLTQQSVFAETEETSLRLSRKWHQQTSRSPAMDPSRGYVPEIR